MSGTIEGGRKAAATNKARHGKAFYSEIGAKGGSREVAKGFALMPRERHQAVSAVGGRNGKPGPRKPRPVA